MIEAIIKTKDTFDRHGESQRKFISPTFNAICATFIIDTLALQIGFLSFRFISHNLKQKAKIRIEKKERDFTLFWYKTKELETIGGEDWGGEAKVCSFFFFWQGRVPEYVYKNSFPIKFLWSWIIFDINFREVNMSIQLA